VNIALILEMAADGMGRRRAIGELTFGQVRTAAAHVARRAAGGPGQSTTLTTLLPNGPHLPIALFGAAWAGMSYAPLNYRLSEASKLELVRRVQPAVDFDESWIAATGETPPQPYVNDPVNPAVLLFTSGTSAAPKAAVLEHDNLAAYLFNTLEFGSAEADEAVLISVPPFHIAGVAAVLSSTYVGRRIVPLPRFEALEWLRLAQEEAVTHAMVVPTMLARIVAALRADPSLRPTTLRSLAYGGARMPAPILEHALELLPGVGFVNAYGLTETSSTVAVLGPDEHREAFASSNPLLRRRLASCGRALPGIEFAVRDGELWIRGDQIGGGYVGATSQVDSEGWLHTGDQGIIDEDGYIFVVGRADDMIIRGGENLSPAEIEDTLLRHPDVTGAAVVGIPDEEWGELVAAMIVTESGATTNIEAIQAWVKDHLGSLKTPQRIVVIDELPSTPTGKILRREVRERLSLGPVRDR
jgi:acyl-CoA synthetase (AMP-forming)/AMP-acid ligase II